MIVKEEMVDVGLHRLKMEVVLFDCVQFGSEIEPNRPLTPIFGFDSVRLPNLL